MYVSSLYMFLAIYLILHCIFLLIYISFILKYVNMSLCVILCDYIWGKHNICCLSPLYSYFWSLHVVLLYIKHVFLYFTAVVVVGAKLGCSSQNLCAYLLFGCVYYVTVMKIRN